MSIGEGNGEKRKSKKRWKNEGKKRKRNCHEEKLKNSLRRMEKGSMRKEREGEEKKWNRKKKDFTSTSVVNLKTCQQLAVYSMSNMTVPKKITLCIQQR